MATTTRTVADIDRDIGRHRWVAKQADAHGDRGRAEASRDRIDQLLDERLAAAAPRP